MLVSLKAPSQFEKYTCTSRTTTVTENHFSKIGDPEDKIKYISISRVNCFKVGFNIAPML
jgi:hypothetical protein